MKNSAVACFRSLILVNGYRLKFGVVVFSRFYHYATGIAPAIGYT